MNDSPLVYAVVLHYQDEDLTRRCLRALSGSRYKPLKIILLTNGATPLNPHMERVEALSTGGNLGYTGGNNAGIALAKERGAELILLLNPDAVVDPDMVSSLVRAAIEYPKAGILGPKVLQDTEASTIESAGTQVDMRWGRIVHRGFSKIDRGQYDSIKRCDAVSGCAFMIRTEVLESTSAFDSRYFSYFEDVDLCLRARTAGYHVLFVGTANVRHKGRGPIRADDDRIYYAMRNHLLALNSNDPLHGTRNAIRNICIVLWNLLHLCRFGPRIMIAQLGSLIRGIRDYRHGRFGSFRSPLESGS